MGASRLTPRGPSRKVKPLIPSSCCQVGGRCRSSFWRWKAQDPCHASAEPFPSAKDSRPSNWPEIGTGCAEQPDSPASWGRPAGWRRCKTPWQLSRCLSCSTHPRCPSHCCRQSQYCRQHRPLHQSHQSQCCRPSSSRRRNRPRRWFHLCRPSWSAPPKPLAPPELLVPPPPPELLVPPPPPELLMPPEPLALLVPLLPPELLVPPWPPTAEAPPVLPLDHLSRCPRRHSRYSNHPCLIPHSGELDGSPPPSQTESRPGPRDAKNREELVHVGISDVSRDRIARAFNRCPRFASYRSSNLRLGTPHK